MLTNQALADFRNFIKNKIWKAQYKIGSTWYDATISGIDILASGIVRVRIPISSKQGTFECTLYVCAREVYF